MMNTSKTTFGVIFYLKKYKAKKGQAPIYARITIDGQRVDVSTKRFIEESNWNGQKGMARGSREEIKSLNKFLERMKTSTLSRKDIRSSRNTVTFHLSPVTRNGNQRFIALMTWEPKAL